jgi:hypothetical protein
MSTPDQVLECAKRACHEAEAIRGEVDPERRRQLPLGKVPESVWSRSDDSAGPGRLMANALALYRDALAYQQGEPVLDDLRHQIKKVRRLLQ